MSQFNSSSRAKAMCKTEHGANFSLLEFQRRPVGENDVAFDVLYCGICHSDLHFAENDLGNTKYPIVPGHELAGIVRQVGSLVTNFKVGDAVGVGCFVDACLECNSCLNGDEQYCLKGATSTYNDKPSHGRAGEVDFDYTLGGYSNKHVVDQRFLIKVPEGYALEKAGPVFCAGITLYDPLKHWGALKGGLRVGIAGLGGLGQMGLKLALAMGNTVTVVSTSPNKQQLALNMGANNFVVISDKDSVNKNLGSIDLLLNTVSASHQLGQYLPLLSTNGVIVQFGLSPEPHVIHQFPLLASRLTIAGSLIGGIKNTQECINFCHKNNIYIETKLVTVNDIDEVYENLKKGNEQVIRYVIDTSSFEPQQQNQFSTDCKALVVNQAKEKFQVVDYKRKDLEDFDVAFSVDYCGVCHSDLHAADSDWPGTNYPCCPGHELAGTVLAVGKYVTKFQVGDKVGAGFFIDSCLQCANCLKGDENYCLKGNTTTSNGNPQHGRAGNPGQFPYTYGGYSTMNVVHEKFVIRVPQNYPLEYAGPIFCAGVTLYDPLKHWGALKGGLKIGIAGFGGLGVMGVKQAIAMGNEVTVLSTSLSKKETANQMGAKFILMSDEEEKKNNYQSLDLILNTVSVGHDIHQYINLLGKSGTLVQIGGVMEPTKLNQLPLLFNRISVAGSLVGGIKSTQECIDFCAQHNIKPEIKLVPSSDVDQIFDILRGKNDQPIRYVLDIKNHLQQL